MNNCCVCDKLVTDKFFVCANVCKCVIHSSCAGINSAIAFDEISRIQNFSWTCNDCKNSLNKQMDTIETLFENFIKRKSFVHNCVNNGNTEHSNASQSVNTIVKVMESSSSSHCNLSNTNKSNNNNKKQNKQKKSTCSNNNTNGPSANTRSKGDFNNISSVINERNTTSPLTTSAPNVATETINLINKNKNNFIIGSSDEADDIIRVADPRKCIFISRLRNGISESELSQYIKTKFKIQDFQCLKINHRHDADYTSYKVNISAVDLKKVMDPNMWAAGLLVKEFIKPKPKYSQKNFQRNRLNLAQV